MRAILVLLALLLLPLAGHAQGAPDRLAGPWPAPGSARFYRVQAVRFPSASPFGPASVLAGHMPPATAEASLYLPDGASAAHKAPAVVLLHGAIGDVAERGETYGPPLASMGVAVLVVDSFGSRPALGGSFNRRLLNITETMLVTDAYAGLRYLAGRGDIDPARVALLGFSYGGMATTYAMYSLLADRLAPPGLGFAGFVSYYGPCIARFADPRTTGRKLLMLYGAGDELIRPARCAQIADDLRRGGSQVKVVSLPGAVHEWDGPMSRRMIGHNLAACRFTVEKDGTIVDGDTGLPMSGPLLRELELYNCVDARPYPIGRDEAATRTSNRLLTRFLARVFRPGAFPSSAPAPAAR